MAKTTTKRVTRKSTGAANFGSISPKKLIASYNKMVKNVTAFGKLIGAN